MHQACGYQQHSDGANELVQGLIGRGLGGIRLSCSECVG
jgi:hypothetical protein